MPWLSIIMAIITMVASLLAKPKNKAQAVALGAMAGLGTYYVSHNTEWGQEMLGSLDGVVVDQSVASGDIQADGSIRLPDGTIVQRQVLADGSYSTIAKVGATAAAPSGSSTTGWDVLKSWGGTGTAAVVGTTGLVAQPDSFSKYIPYALGVGLFFLLLK